MRNDLKSTLKSHWGYENFRPKQQEIIESILKNKDTLALLPTGGGKSICYQLPAILSEGICIVISPLIALMQDQVEGLKKRNIKTSFINSTMSKREIDITLDNCIFGNIKILYVSPERLKTSIFIERLKKMKVSFVAIDEAHCISQWGYDFRPDYLNIAQLKDIHPNLTFIALTATATPEVAKDIQHQLNFKVSNIIQNSFYRPNLSYKVIRTENKLTQLTKILDNQNSSLIYVNSRRRCHEIAKFLNSKETRVLIYHAGLSNKDRKDIQNKWIDNQYKTIVATNAFGMGIDKPDVSTVVNFDLPSSIESYFQEAGRAGRNGDEANSYLLVNENDKEELKQRIAIKYPPKEIIQYIYQKFCNLHQIAIGSGEGVSYSLNFNSFSDMINKSALEIYNSFRILELSEHLSITNNKFELSRLKFHIFHNELSDYIDRNIKYRSLIKVILRSYSGLFDHKATINEITIANRLNIKPEIVKQHLMELNDLNIVNYLPQNKDTIITFLEPRQDTKRLSLSNLIYIDRKKNELNKVNSVIEYAYNTSNCRNNMLLNYFGENFNNAACSCDICIDNDLNKTPLNKKTIILFIKEQLTERPMEINQLLENKRSESQKKQITLVIRKMLDTNEVMLNELNQLQLVKK